MAVSDTDTLSGNPGLDVGRKGYVLGHHVKASSDCLIQSASLCLGLGEYRRAVDSCIERHAEDVL
jgi:hypothetical protein